MHQNVCLVTKETVKLAGMWNRLFSKSEDYASMEYGSTEYLVKK